MTQAKSDFVNVQLSAAGVAFAGAVKQVRISNGHFSYTFTAGTAVRVLTSEWSRVLSRERYQGQPIFELESSATTTATTAAAQLNTLKAEEAQLEQQIAATK